MYLMDIIPTDILSKIIIGVLSSIGFVFVLVTIALIYHWFYFGISSIRRLFIITVFIGVGFVLYMASWGLAIGYI